MKSKTIHKINAGWVPVGKPLTVFENNTYRMRQMQSDAYEALHDKRHVIINAPTASGKTLAIAWIIAKRLSESPKKKSIIAVPQTIIANGFRGPFNLSFPDGSTKSFAPIHYLCTDSKTSNKAQIKSFLGRSGNARDINDRILVCSHASLIDAFQESPKLFKNLDICIDEAHHIHYSTVETEELEDDAEHTAQEMFNRMGELVSHSLKQKNVGLILSTATLFRGDRLAVIPSELRGRFTSFHYPMDAYLRDCHYLKSFKFDFAMYEGDWGPRLTELLKGSVGKSIIYLPSVGSRIYSYGSKERDLQEVYKAIAGTDSPEIKEREDGATLIKRGKTWIAVVNLVDDSAIREKRKDLVMAAHSRADNSKIDVIVALNMFREGANWRWANREIIIGAKGSLTDMNQMLGRLFRDAQGKEHVEAIQLLPYQFKAFDQDSFRDQLNEYTKVVYATMLFEDEIAPVDLKMPMEREPRKSGQRRPDYLREQVDGEHEICDIYAEIRNAAIKVRDEIDFSKNTLATREAFHKVVFEVLDDHNVTEHQLEIAETIRRRWIVETAKVEGIDLSGVDFEAVNVDPLKFWVHYSSGVCGLDTFKAFREAFEKYGWSETYNLEACYPEIAKEWHPTKNGKKKARDFLPKSDLKVWWKGKCGHEWEARIYVRTCRGHGCPYCSGNRIWNLISYELAKRAIKTAKISSVKDFKARYDQIRGMPSNPNIVYKSQWKSWRSFLRGDERTLASEYPELAKQWHKTKNGQLSPDDFRPKAKKRIFWLCDKCGHEWEATISNRVVRGSGCPRCAGLAGKLSFAKARTLVRKLGVKTLAEYQDKSKSGELPPELAGCPYRAYSSHPDWCGIKDFLGVRIGKVVRLTFAEARIVAQKLNIKTKAEYNARAKVKALPDGLPADPYHAYSSHPDWRGIKDFLGTEESKPLCADNPKWEQFVKQNL